MLDWSTAFAPILAEYLEGDGSHDLGHLRRVCRDALRIGEVEGGDPEVLVAASWFHDVINLPKDHPQRERASVRSAEAAQPILRELGFPEEKLAAVAHAIEAHSFSAGIEPRTLEAKIVQDADRMEALGAIGIARLFYVAGRMGQELFDGADPRAQHRPLDDRQYALDHFKTKLFVIADTLQTETARQMARERVALMRTYVDALVAEVEQ